MINVNKLKGKIVENGLSVADVAKAIGIGTASLYRKMNGKDETMYVKDAYAIGQLLHLTTEEMNAIFLPLISQI
ncbi:XRE family transcriptional regulator [Selenomonas sp. WCA-380-WT-3B 3/]|uniref:XRE family transcriptional regulator n=1 Tax=Selenomonas montiformis TaxID=2652285 RepID=A0A6I2V200_9FIRM|nr:helix-turn-helix domain-containing protein [Selenomonas montiformis]MSV25981.1 XRE family transcriptional regulator [Selenomonas montiformis]